MIVVRKVVRSLMAVMPGWLLVVFGVCLAIPLARLLYWFSRLFCAWRNPQEPQVFLSR